MTLTSTGSKCDWCGRSLDGNDKPCSTSSSSFASIRDEADYAATLMFNDCENVRDMEPSKREFLLAGNTKGTQVLLKEPIGEAQWKTRRVNSFAARGFSSIGLPDPVLGDRSIRIPLVASTDKAKTRRSPERKSDWKHDPWEIIDDLWVLAVTYLHTIQEHDMRAGQLTNLVGRAS